MPDIFEFTHFRRYLEEMQEVRVLEDQSFNRTAICKKLGLPNTRSYFADVLRGKVVSSRMATRFCEVFELDAKESAYFHAMVELDQAKTSERRKAALNALLSLHPTPQRILQSDSYEYWSKWQHSTLFAILDVVDIADDVSGVSKCIYPPISSKKITESLALLARLELIRKNEFGFWKPSRDSISSGPFNNDDLIKQYHIQSFELSKYAILSPDEHPNVMSTFVFSASKNAYTELAKKLQEFKEDARRILRCDNEKPNGVYRLNLHLFTNFDQEEK